MKKFLITFLVILVIGCSPAPGAVATEPSGNQQTANPAPKQSAIPPTHILPLQPTFTPAIAPTPISGGAGRIAFTSDRDGYPEIYVMDSDGSGLVKLANDITPKSDPAWSPDGSMIAFGFSSDDSASLYVMNADGSDPTKLIDTKGFSSYSQLTPDWRSFSISYPTWSPDGSKIAFMYSYYVNCCSGRSTINVMDADGSILASAALPGYETFDWSPDSQNIAFGADCGGNSGICVMNTNGAISYIGDGGRPTWSPDGKKIAFKSGPYKNVEVYAMNADGSNQTNLTNYRGGWDGDPTWSPEGGKIAFSSYRDGNYEIYVMNADGGNQINVTNHPAGDNNPVWSPDGSKIAFESDRDGNLEIYVVNADGSSLVRLTNNDANDYSPVWSP